MNERILFQGNWITVAEKDGYEYVKDSSGHGVLVLPYKISANGELWILAREEPVPPHYPSMHLCGLTGTHEEGESLSLTAVRELREESGFIVSEEFLFPLGWTFVSKASTFKCHMYAVDVTKAIWEEPKGDGSELEKRSSCKWLTLEQAIWVPDSTFGQALSRMAFYDDRF